MSLLLINDVPIECINHAAQTYHVPATLIISVMKIENGRLGMANRNKNGSIDFGPMQINSSWLPKLKPFGYTAYQLRYNPCANVQVGAWILSQTISEEQDIWHGVGNYHSHDIYRNAQYRSKVMNIYTLLLNYLNAKRDPELMANRG